MGQSRRLCLKASRWMSDTPECLIPIHFDMLKQITKQYSLPLKHCSLRYLSRHSPKFDSYPSLNPIYSPQPPLTSKFAPSTQVKNRRPRTNAPMLLNPIRPTARLVHFTPSRASIIKLWSALNCIDSPEYFIEFFLMHQLHSFLFIIH